MKKCLIVASSGAVPAIQVLFFILRSTSAGATRTRRQRGAIVGIDDRMNLGKSYRIIS